MTSLSLLPGQTFGEEDGKVVFRTDPHTERTKSLIEQGDLISLRYACLELRLAIERIAYQKLQLRLSAIGLRDISGWQPKRVLDTLMELVDPDLSSDYTLSVGQREGGGDPETDTFAPIGSNKGINPKDLGKHWHKLSHFLHMRMPSKKGESPKDPEPAKLKRVLKEALRYVEDATSTRFDSHFSENVTFTCGSCKQLVIRNIKLLNEGDIVQCQNDQCDLSYITHKEGDDFRFEPYFLRLKCEKCDNDICLDANRVLRLPVNEAFNARCPCGARYQVRWAAQYGLLPSETEQTSGQ